MKDMWTCRAFVPVAGDNITHACQEAVRLSKLLGVAIEFNFNSFGLIAHPDTEPDELAREYGRRYMREV